MRSSARSQVWTFEEALTLTCEAGQPLSRSVVARLSGPGRAEMGRFGECWRAMPVERRRELIAMMAEMAEADFELDFNAIFRLALDDKDPAVRERAVEGLWEDDNPLLIDPLIRLLLEDPEPAVRAQAAISLGRFALMAELGDVPEGKAARLRAALLGVIDNRDETVEVRRRAVEAVAYLSDVPVRRIVENAYADADPRMRLSAVFAMGRTADKRWAEPIMRELHAGDPAMRYEAARAAGEVGLQAAAGDLIALLNDADSEVRQMAIWALGQIGGPHARRALETCQASRDEAVREAAEEALAELDLASMPLDMFYYEPGAPDGDEDEPEA